MISGVPEKEISSVIAELEPILEDMCVLIREGGWVGVSRFRRKRRVLLTAIFSTITNK